MNKGLVLTIAAAALTCLALAAWSPKQDAKPLLLTRQDLDWGLGPDAFPLGVHASIVEGDPDQDEPFTMRFKLPGKYRIEPHWTTREQRLTVLSGSIELALGERFDERKLKTYGEGSYLVIPARARYYLKCDRGSVLELRSQGPWEVNYVDRADDPREQAASL